MDLLIVDDEYPLRAAVRRALSLEGYAVSEAASGEEAIQLLEERQWDAVILDVLMAGLSGLDVCRRLRAGGDRTPILMLTARETVEDRVVGLEAGADDYLVKPFALAELLARVKALLRRTFPDGDGTEALRFDTLTLDPAGHEVRVGAVPGRADQDRVLIAASVDAQSGAGAVTGDDQRAGLGL